MSGQNGRGSALSSSDEAASSSFVSVPSVSPACSAARSEGVGAAQESVQAGSRGDTRDEEDQLDERPLGDARVLVKGG